MYTGHIGVALGAHGLRKTIPLWILIVATQLPDWADAVACTVGRRPEVPGMYSHSLPAVALLAALAAMFYYIREKDTVACAVIAAVVLSHAAGDYFTGIKPTWPGGPMIGLLWYRRPVLDFVLETLVVTGGWFLYRRAVPRERMSSRGMLEMLAVLVAIQIGADIIMWFFPPLTKC